MEIREVACVICGKKIPVRSINYRRMYCSVLCAYQGKRKRYGLEDKTPASACIHNKFIECEIRKCSTCGWNPEVEQKRKEAFAYGEE